MSLTTYPADKEARYQAYKRGKTIYDPAEAKEFADRKMAEQRQAFGGKSAADTDTKKPKVPAWQRKTFHQLEQLRAKSPNGIVHIGDLESAVNPPSRAEFQKFIKQQIDNGNIGATDNQVNPSAERTAIQSAYDKTVGISAGRGKPPLVNLDLQNVPDFKKGTVSPAEPLPNKQPANSNKTPKEQFIEEYDKLQADKAAKINRADFRVLQGGAPSAPPPTAQPAPASGPPDGIPDFLRRGPGNTVPNIRPPQVNPAVPAQVSTPPPAAPPRLPGTAATVTNGSMTPSSGNIPPPSQPTLPPQAAGGNGGNQLVPYRPQLPSGPLGSPASAVNGAGTGLPPTAGNASAGLPAAPSAGLPANGSTQVTVAKTGALDPWGPWSFNKGGAPETSTAGSASGAPLSPTSTPRLPPPIGPGLGGGISGALGALGPVAGSAASQPSVYPSVQDLANHHNGGGLLDKLTEAFKRGQATGRTEANGGQLMPVPQPGPGGGTPVTPTGPLPPASQTFRGNQPIPVTPTGPQPPASQTYFPGASSPPVPLPPQSQPVTGASAWGMSPAQYAQALAQMRATNKGIGGNIPGSNPANTGGNTATGPVPQTTAGPGIIQNMLTTLFGKNGSGWNQQGTNTASGATGTGYTPPIGNGYPNY